ncbi:DUF6602 domain-containing protein [Sunxiuqinia indica]|uniref:DUF6602 domain-containing protein n=1 Tax=Sunxiuqinia indica TaxID=2692584 RepID=UPI001358B264|nr:DUF6602 domain-containing protein [Sunxiuqinia indica]
MSSEINLKVLFKGLQKQMVSQMETNRESIQHPGTKGDSFEDIWIVWLRKYLPSRYCVDKAIVIDSKSQTSDQIDLVIYDQTYTPFVFNQNGVKYIPAEGVYAVFEVKPELSKKYILYAGDKVESVRKLERTSASIIDRGRKHPPRSLTQILGGILALETTTEDSTIEKHIKSLKGLKSLEIGCAVNHKSFTVDYKSTDTSTEALDLLDNNQKLWDYYANRSLNSVEFSFKYNSLVTFFLQLTRYLQQSIGTVAAIDLSEYANAINFDIDEEL